MWNGRSVSVALMTYAEKDSIKAIIDGFYATGWVDEVVVIDNNSVSGTVEEVSKTEARIVHEALQGYGHASRRALREVGGDLVVLAEPDGTFRPEDIHKLLVYSDECDVVFGTRTTREMVWDGANMDRFLKWGNWSVAKLIELLFNTSHLSDVGCTFRVLNRDTARYVADHMTIGGSHAGIEIMLLSIASGRRFVEVPVNYLPRVGESSVTGKRAEAVRVGLQMITLVLRTRFRSLAPPPAPPARVADRNQYGSTEERVSA